MGHAAQRPARKARSAVAAQHDQVTSASLSGFHQLLGRDAIAHLGADCYSRKIPSRGDGGEVVGGPFQLRLDDLCGHHRNRGEPAAVVDGRVDHLHQQQRPAGGACNTCGHRQRLFCAKRSIERNYYLLKHHTTPFRRRGSSCPSRCSTFLSLSRACELNRYILLEGLNAAGVEILQQFLL